MEGRGVGASAVASEMNRPIRLTLGRAVPLSAGSDFRSIGRRFVLVGKSQVFVHQRFDSGLAKPKTPRVNRLATLRGITAFIDRMISFKCLMNST
jgi:hypothetical protein